jgi:2,3-bisphosphoglycerate-dependent phosphoglycerate mutase
VKLFLIRHGQSTNNVTEILGTGAQNRKPDPFLTDIGKTQAQLLADFIKAHPQQFGFTHLYVSPMRRTLQTAQPLAQALNMPMEVWTDVYEMGGVYEEVPEGGTKGGTGLTRSEIQKDFPEAVMGDDVTENGWYDANKNMESVSHFLMRAIKLNLTLRERHKTSERIAIVTHGLFMDALMKALTNTIPTSPKDLFYLFYNTGITRVEFNEKIGHYDEKMRIYYQNRLDHLPDHLRTA